MKLFSNGKKKADRRLPGPGQSRAERVAWESLGDGNVFSLDKSVGYMNECICQNASNYALRSVPFSVCKLYPNKKEKNYACCTSQPSERCSCKVEPLSTKGLGVPEEMGREWV